MSQTYDMDADRREQEKQQAESERQKGERPGDSDRHVDEAVLQPIQDIQVLDLHSKRPFISYRGRVFEGEWAEVVGTELILAGSDGKNRDLPTLRTLPGDVSLLAASCSRILTTEKALKPREPEEDPLAEVRKEWLINIPSGIDKSGERARQASFLEKLIGLKLKKGEPDQVTVYAKEAVGKDFKDHRDPTSRTRRRLQGPDDELNDGSHTVAKKPRLRLTGRHRRGSGRGPLRVIPADEILSVPTPNRWVDLRAHNEDGDEEEAEAEEDEDDEDEDRGAASDDIDSLDEKDVEDEEETERDNNRESQESDSAQLIEEEEEDEDEEDDDDDDEDMGSDASHTKGNDQVKEQEVIMRESG